MKYSDYFMFFGIVSIVLGVLGYVRAKSVASLYAGGLSGILLAFSAVMAAKRAHAADLVNWGYIIALVLSVALLGRFLPGFLKSKNFYPAGIMAVLSVLGVVAGILALMKIGPLTTRLIRNRWMAYPRTNSTAAETNMPRNGSSPNHWCISQPT